MSAQIKEIVMNADCFELEYVCPDAGKLFFNFIARGGVLSLQAGTNIPRVRQCLPVQFSIRIEWKLV